MTTRLEPAMNRGVDLWAIRLGTAEMDEADLAHDWMSAPILKSASANLCVRETMVLVTHLRERVWCNSSGYENENYSFSSATILPLTNSAIAEITAAPKAKA